MSWFLLIFINFCQFLTIFCRFWLLFDNFCRFLTIFKSQIIEESKAKINELAMKYWWKLFKIDFWQFWLVLIERKLTKINFGRFSANFWQFLSIFVNFLITKIDCKDQYCNLLHKFTSVCMIRWWTLKMLLKTTWKRLIKTY